MACCWGNTFSPAVLRAFTWTKMPVSSVLIHFLCFKNERMDLNKVWLDLDAGAGLICTLFPAICLTVLQASPSWIRLSKQNAFCLHIYVEPILICITCVSLSCMRVNVLNCKLLWTAHLHTAMARVRKYCFSKGNSFVGSGTYFPTMTEGENIMASDLSTTHAEFIFPEFYRHPILSLSSTENWRQWVGSWK